MLMLEQHTAKAFDVDLAGLSRGLGEMSKITESEICDASGAFVRGDRQLATRAVAKADAVAALHREVENMAILTIARRQPMAIDLRAIIGALKTSRDLERVGSLARNIAQRATSAGPRPQQFVRSFEQLIQLAGTQLHDTIDAYLAGDAQGAIVASARGMEVSLISDDLTEFLHSFIREDKQHVEIGVHLLLCTANLRNASEHVSHIAETAYYIVEGQPLIKRRVADSASLAVAV